MARMKNGPYGPVIGKVGNTVGYIRRGEAILRINGKPSKKPKTLKQKAAFDRMRVIMELIKPLNAFINSSFKLAVNGSTRIPQNEAVSVNINAALKGEYPNLEVDYPKVVLSKGDLLPAVNPVVTADMPPVTHHFQAMVTIKFKWDTTDWDEQNRRAQVMMVAYLPDNKNAFFSVSGARRYEGEDTLQGIIYIADHGSHYKDTCIETYIAFISDDRESISDSIYVGQITL